MERARRRDRMFCTSKRLVLRPQRCARALWKKRIVQLYGARAGNPRSHPPLHQRQRRCELDVGYSCQRGTLISSSSLFLCCVWGALVGWVILGSNYTADIESMRVHVHIRRFTGTNEDKIHTLHISTSCDRMFTMYAPTGEACWKCPCHHGLSFGVVFLARAWSWF